MTTPPPNSVEKARELISKIKSTGTIFIESCEVAIAQALLSERRLALEEAAKIAEEFMPEQGGRTFIFGTDVAKAIRSLLEVKG